MAYAYLDEYKQAKRDLKQALAISPELADVYANLGTLQLAIEAAPGALENFQKAKEHSNGFALARNDIACARLGYATDPESIAKALSDFEAAKKCPAVEPLVASNMKSILDPDRNSGNGSGSRAKGMTVRTLFDMNPAQREPIIRGMSDRQLREAYGKESWNQKWSNAWGLLLGGQGEAGGYLGARGAGLGGYFKGDFRDLSERSYNDGRTHGDLNTQMLQEMQRRGMEPGPGGGDMEGVALENSFGEAGRWLAKDTRFGLFPRIELPKVTPPVQ